jgi:hypothetical protein
MMRRGRPSDFPIYGLDVGESVVLPFDLATDDFNIDTKANALKIERIRRYSYRTGKQFRREVVPGGVKVTRLYDKASSSPI